MVRLLSSSIVLIEILYLPRGTKQKLFYLVMEEMLFLLVILLAFLGSKERSAKTEISNRK